MSKTEEQKKERQRKRNTKDKARQLSSVAKETGEKRAKRLELMSIHHQQRLRKETTEERT